MARSRLFHPYALAAVIGLCSLAVRLIFLSQAKLLASTTPFIPHLDEFVYWVAAQNIRFLAPTDVNFELLGCSTPLHVGWLMLLQELTGDQVPMVKLVHVSLASLRYPLFFFALLNFRCQWVWSFFVTLAVAMLPATIVFDGGLMKAFHGLNFMVGIIFVCSLYSARQISYVLGVLLNALFLSLAVLNQANTLLWFLPCALFWWISMERKLPGIANMKSYLTLSSLAAFPLITAICLSAWTTGTPQTKWSMIPHTGINLRLGWHPDASVEYQALDGWGGFPVTQIVRSRVSASAETGRHLDFKVSDQFYRSAAVEYFFSEPVAAVSLLIKRIFAAMNQHELKGVHYLPFLQENLPILTMMPFHYGYLFFLATLGALALWLRQDYRILVLPLGLVGTVLLSCSLTFLFYRFRAPIYFPLAMLATAVCLFPAAWKESGLRQRIICGMVLVLVAIAAFYPANEKRHVKHMNRAGANERIARKNEGELPIELGHGKRFQQLRSKVLSGSLLSSREEMELIRYFVWIGDGQRYGAWISEHPGLRDRLLFGSQQMLKREQQALELMTQPR